LSLDNNSKYGNWDTLMASALDDILEKASTDTSVSYAKLLNSFTTIPKSNIRLCFKEIEERCHKRKTIEKKRTRKVRDMFLLMVKDLCVHKNFEIDISFKDATMLLSQKREYMKIGSETDKKKYYAIVMQRLREREKVEQ
jgi:hypothetical protein